MPILPLLPAALAFLLAAAHVFRAGWILLVPVCLLLVALLGWRERWVPRIVQAALALVALEWVRTLAVLAAERAAEGRPALRLALILGGVAVFTLGAALLLQLGRVQRWYAGGPAPVRA